MNTNTKKEAVEENSTLGNWSELRTKIKATWSKFSDEELDSLKGNLEQLSGKIQKTYGHAKERADQEYTTFRATLSKAIAPETAPKLAAVKPLPAKSS